MHTGLRKDQQRQNRAGDVRKEKNWHLTYLFKQNTKRFWYKNVNDLSIEVYIKHSRPFFPNQPLTQSFLLSFILSHAQAKHEFLGLVVVR